MTDGDKNYPPAPRIHQQEFVNGDNGRGVPEKPQDDMTQGEQVTPLSLIIPTFESVHTLPTPMTYTPPASLPRSPVRQTLVIPKRRGDALNGQVFDVGAQHRVISELYPLPESAQQRVSSLPTVSEASSISEFPASGRVNETQEDGQDDDSILTGYKLANLSVPLKWRKIRQIGSGNFSNVFLYESLDQNDQKLRQVSVKRVKYPEELIQGRSINQQLAKDLLSRLESSLTRELAILRSMNHPCIVKLLGINNPVFIKSKKPLRDLMLKGKSLPRCDMIMSYCAGGDLLMAATSCNGQLGIPLLQRLFSELVLAVKYLHDNNVIHRDLKLENILLKFPLEAIIDMKDSPVYMKHNFIELGDFGLCKKIEPGELCTARCGSEDYVCPEILMGVPYDGRLSDTWALGVILYGLLEDRLPFDPPPNASARQRNRATSHRIARYDWKWFRLLNESLPAKEIVEHTLTRKSERWTINEIIESEFVKPMASVLPFRGEGQA